MKKWVKRIIIAAVLLIVLIVAGGLTIVYMSGSRPSWYRSKKLDAKEQLVYSEQAKDKFVRMLGWAQDSSNWPVDATRARVDTDPTTAPAKTYTISLSEDELNAVLNTWVEPLLEHYGKYISDPFLGLQDGHIVLAVTLKDSERVLSVHVQPVLDEKGMLTLSVDSLMAGRITVPKVLWSGYLQKLGNELKPKLESVRSNARLEASGTANTEAVASGMCRLVLQSLQGKPGDPILFLPNDISHLERGYPVRLTEVAVADQTLKLTVVTLTGEEQQHLLARLRAPFGEEPEPALAAKK